MHETIIDIDRRKQDFRHGDKLSCINCEQYLYGICTIVNENHGHMTTKLMPNGAIEKEYYGVLNYLDPQNWIIIKTGSKHLCLDHSKLTGNMTDKITTLYELNQDYENKLKEKT